MNSPYPNSGYQANLPAQAGPEYPSSPGVPMPQAMEPAGYRTQPVPTVLTQAASPGRGDPISTELGSAERSSAVPGSAERTSAVPASTDLVSAELGSTEPGTGPIPPGTAPRRHSRVGAAWVALIVAAIVLIFLLIFVVQNSDPVQVRYLGFEGTLPLGVAMMFAAVAGALTAGLLGTVRILQLRSRARKAALR